MTEDMEFLRGGIAHVAGEVGQEAARSDVALNRILCHLAEVRRFNRTVNLTSITDPTEMIVKHAIDSAACLVGIAPEDHSMVDLGSGAGFPGLVLKSLLPRLRVSLLEAVAKKCRFLEHTATLLGWTGEEGGINVICGRAEQIGKGQPYRGAFDLVVARAVAALPVVIELGLPLAKVGGKLIAMRGPSGLEEIGDSTVALEMVGGQVMDAARVELPGGLGARVLAVIIKTRATPPEFPRREGIPQRRPLGSG